MANLLKIIKNICLWNYFWNMHTILWEPFYQKYLFQYLKKITFYPFCCNTYKFQNFLTDILNTQHILKIYSTNKKIPFSYTCSRLPFSKHCLCFFTMDKIYKIWKFASFQRSKHFCYSIWCESFVKAGKKTYAPQI